MKIDRHYSALLHRYLEYFPCVTIMGSRQCGKTTLLESLGSDWRRYDLEKPEDYSAIANDPYDFLRTHPSHIAIDEAQLLPALFPALRVVIDQAREQRGRFVLTGSSSPQLSHAVHESLAGRVGMIPMSPLMLTEAFQRPSSGFYSAVLSRQPLEAWLGRLETRITPVELERYWFQGGFPEPWVRQDAGFRRAWLQAYVQNYIERDLQRLFPGLDTVRFRRFLEMLAALSGSVINYSNVARDLAVSAPTVKDYVGIAEGLFLWRSISTYATRLRKRLVKHPKGYLRDTGLLHYWLRVPESDALRVHPQRGASWEGLAAEMLIQGFAAQGENVQARFYRTRSGVEVDLILEGSFGTLPIQVKAASSVDSKALPPLRDFIEAHRCPYGLVIHNGDRPERLGERLAAIPLACL
jgi:predicted AAA+ superfamily ATPase